MYICMKSLKHVGMYISMIPFRASFGIVLIFVLEVKEKAYVLTKDYFSCHSKHSILSFPFCKLRTHVFINDAVAKASCVSC
jgi:predicted nucleic acid-binding Zn finger protein